MMSDNPFQPPRARLNEPRPRKGSLLKGVLSGIAVDLGGTYLLVTVLVIVYVTTRASTQMSGEQMRSVVEQFSHQVATFDNVWSWSALTLGLLSSFFGGYVCAARARERRVKALVILAFTMTIFSFQAADNLEVGINLVLCLLTASAIVAGGRTWAARSTPDIAHPGN